MTSPVRAVPAGRAVDRAALRREPAALRDELDAVDPEARLDERATAPSALRRPAGSESAMPFGPRKIDLHAARSVRLPPAAGQVKGDCLRRRRRRPPSRRRRRSSLRRPPRPRIRDSAGGRSVGLVSDEPPQPESAIERRTRKASRRTRGSVVRRGGSSGAAGPVQLLVDPPRGLGRHARDAFELLLRGRRDPFGGAEVLQERPPAHRADSVELIEHRSTRGAVAALTVEGRRRTGAPRRGPLQQVQARRVLGQDDRIGRPGTNTSSTRFASAITATRGRSSSWIAASAALNCPLPPSITTRFGAAANDSFHSSDPGFAASREKRREITSRIDAKSSWPSTSRTANLR